MNKLKTFFKGKGGKIVLIVGGVAIAYYLYKNYVSGGSGGGSTTPISGTTPPNNVVTRIVKKTQVINHYKNISPAHITPGRWAHYNILVGRRQQLQQATGFERTWLDKLKAIPAGARTKLENARIAGLQHRLTSQSHELTNLNSQIHDAYQKAIHTHR